jgi:uncharacterized membrane protein YcjF (UPF0283 family)
MFDKIWHAIKYFYTHHEQHAWLEYTFLVCAIICMIIFIILIVKLWVKENKEIKQLNRDKRKRDKELLKFLSTKENKTW